jgi:hypothetical protein
MGQMLILRRRKRERAVQLVQRILYGLMLESGLLRREREDGGGRRFTGIALVMQIGGAPL